MKILNAVYFIMLTILGVVTVITLFLSMLWLCQSDMLSGLIRWWLNKLSKITNGGNT